MGKKIKITESQLKGLIENVINEKSSRIIENRIIDKLLSNKEKTLGILNKLGVTTKDLPDLRKAYKKMEVIQNQTPVKNKDQKDQLTEWDISKWFPTHSRFAVGGTVGIILSNVIPYLFTDPGTASTMAMIGTQAGAAMIALGHIIDILEISDENQDNITEHNWGERKERRFRSSIYVDIFVPETDSIENDREEAQKIAKEISNDIDYNSYVGGTAHWGMKGLSIPKDELDRL